MRRTMHPSHRRTRNRKVHPRRLPAPPKVGRHRRGPESHMLRSLGSHLRALFLHPLRSFLTILGVSIGVASVIWLLAIGEGIGQAVQKQIEGLGADNIIVRSIKPPAETTAGRDGIFP